MLPKRCAPLGGLHNNPYDCVQALHNAYIGRGESPSQWSVERAFSLVCLQAYVYSEALMRCIHHLRGLYHHLDGLDRHTRGKRLRGKLVRR
jgi:hypothetical protein